MDPIEQQLLIQEANFKSPGLAAVMGFFFPWLPAFYTGRIGTGIGLLVFDLIFMALSVVGIGLFLLLLYGFIGAYQGYAWAKDYNKKRLQELLAARQANTAGGAGLSLPNQLSR